MTFDEFVSRFSTEEQCRDYLYGLRWPDGFLCPKCGARKRWELGATLYECAKCGRQTSVIAGTVFQDTRRPLKTWFVAIWWITTRKYGASAEGLRQVLGLKSYETSWTWLHKIRHAMARPGRSKLQGKTEVDEAYIGGREKGGKQEAVSKKHLQSYLDEYVFRFNRRKSAKRGVLFYRLLECAMNVEPITLDQLIREPSAGQRKT